MAGWTCVRSSMKRAHGTPGRTDRRRDPPAICPPSPMRWCSPPYDRRPGPVQHVALGESEPHALGGVAQMVEPLPDVAPLEGARRWLTAQQRLPVGLDARPFLGVQGTPLRSADDLGGVGVAVVRLAWRPRRSPTAQVTEQGGKPATCRELLDTAHLRTDHRTHWATRWAFDLIVTAQDRGSEKRGRLGGSVSGTGWVSDGGFREHGRSRQVPARRCRRRMFAALETQPPGNSGSRLFAG
jgi:hypothetical protein